VYSASTLNNLSACWIRIIHLKNHRYHSGYCNFYFRYIAQNPDDVFDYDVHWRPQVALCNPCIVNYDYIVRFENLVEDSNLLMEYLQRNDPEKDKISFRNKTSSHIGISKTLQAISNLEPDLINGLVNIYKDDFTIMGYGI